MILTTPSLMWFIMGVLLFLMEMAVPGFVLFFFGVGAWVTALLSFVLPLGLNAQILIFTVSSVISLVVLRKFVRSAFTGGSSEAEGEEVMVKKGTRVEVVNDILPPAEGKVKYSGTTWRAKADMELKTGEYAEVVEQQGLVFTVKSIDS